MTRGDDGRAPAAAVMFPVVFPPSQPTNPAFSPGPNFSGSSYGPGYSGAQPLLGESSQRAPMRTVGPYQLLTQLGNTSQGPVFAARIPGNEAQFALKIFQRQLPPEEVARVRQEIQAVSRLEHPGIVRPVDVGLEQSRLYVVYEHVPGPTLQEQLSKNGPLPSDQAARMVADLAEAIHAAHEVGVLHRDLHPGCVVVDSRTGRARVGDFGHPHDLAAGGTQARPTYQAPEQLRGEQVDPRTDVYGLGAILYELLTCMPPFSGLSHEELRQRILAGHPDAPRDLVASVDSAVERVCLRALALHPRKRHASADALSQALRRAADRGAGRASMAVVGGLGLGWFLSLAVVGTWGWREHTDRLAAVEEAKRTRAEADRASADAAAIGTELDRAKSELAREKQARGRSEQEAGRLRSDIQTLQQQLRAGAGGGQVVVPARGGLHSVLEQLDDDLAQLPGSERLRVRLLLARMAYKPAGQLLEELRKHDPEDEWLLLSSIRCAGAMGDQARVQALREELERRASPGGGGALYARFLARQGQQTTPQEWQALLGDMREAAARTRTAPLHVLNANILFQTGQQQPALLQEALKEAEAALKIDPLDAEARAIRAQLYLLAFRLGGNRDPEPVCRALGDFELLRELTGRPSYWLDVAEIHAMFRDNHHALAQVQEGLRIADAAGYRVEMVAGRVQLGTLCFAMGDAKSGVTHYQEAIQRAEGPMTQPMAHALIGIVNGLVQLPENVQQDFLRRCPAPVAELLKGGLAQVRQQPRPGGQRPR